MTTALSFEYAHDEELQVGHTNEVRTPDALVEHFLKKYSEPGENVIDIFAGYGTTLKVAERLQRVPYGLEYESDRVSHIQSQVSTPTHVHQGSILELDPSWFPACDCCFTSPPFIEQTSEQNPFQNYSGTSTYEDYLDDIEAAFTQLDSVLAPGGRLIVDVCNIKYEGRVTTLAWDVAERISNVFHFDGEVVITWEGDGSPNDRDGRFGYGYDHTYCLVFTKSDR